MPAQDELQPWQWDEPTWRAMAGKVSAGRSLKPPAWKDGARCAVALSFDSDHETTDLVDGGRSIGVMSQGEYGSRRGMPRILELLSRYEVPATFFVPAVSALLHPQEQRRAVELGHEVGLHGWIHEPNAKLTPEVERELALRSADTLERITGVRPVGMRTPSWDFSAATLSVAREVGLVYDSSLMADDDPYELLQDGKPTGLVELPVEWIRDDAIYLNMVKQPAIRPHTSPDVVLDIFKREFDVACKERGLFQLTCHPHIIGHRSRIGILEGLVEHIKARSDVWFATHAQVAEYVVAHKSHAP
jgi:peptidoglycan-N-acetylglucosamine deacetylase